MADCSHGPVSTMPGSIHKVPANSTCDDHPDKIAVIRIQGETDSFGCEYIDMCQECKDAYYAAKEEARSGICDWCNHESIDLKKTRDYDEGMTGPVYDVCPTCRKAANDRAAEELDELHSECPILDDDLDDDDADEPWFDPNEDNTPLLNQDLEA